MKKKLTTQAVVNQFGGWFVGSGSIIGTIVAVIVLAALIYLLVRPYKTADKLSVKL